MAGEAEGRARQSAAYAPTRRLRVAAALLAAALIAAACSSDSSDSTRPGGTGTMATTATPAPTAAPVPPPPGEITRWTLVDALRGFADTTNEQFFTSVVGWRRVDAQGGEVVALVTPQNDPDCTQSYRLTWDFDRDIASVSEDAGYFISSSLVASGDTATGELRECFVEATREMAYDGQMVAEVVAPAGSHFITQPAYVRYHQADAQYLFTTPDNPGALYAVDPGFAANVGGTVASLFVRDGDTIAGTANAPHGAFSIKLTLDGAFEYAVTYLYDAVGG